MNNETGGGERERASASPNKDPAHRPWSMKALFVSVVNARPLNIPVYSKEKKKKAKKREEGEFCHFGGYLLSCLATVRMMSGRTEKSFPSM